MIRFAQVGLGGFGKSWAQLLASDPLSELVAVADPATTAQAWAADKFGLGEDQIFGHLEELAGLAGVAAILLTTPPPMHVPGALVALAAGKHVLLEKPLATTIADALALRNAARNSGRIVAVSQNYRYRRPTRGLRDALSAGVIGELQAVRIQFRRDTRTIFGEGNFRYSMEHPLVLDMSIHHFDLLRMITGRNIERVAAVSWPLAGSNYLHHPAVSAVFTLTGGIAATYDGTWASNDGNTSWNGHWELLGTNGRLRLEQGDDDPMNDLVTLFRDGQPSERLPLPELERIDRAGSLASFVAAIEQGGVPETAIEDNIWSLGAVLATVEAANSGRVVNVTDLLGETAD